MKLVKKKKKKEKMRKSWEQAAKEEQRKSYKEASARRDVFLSTLASFQPPSRTFVGRLQVLLLKHQVVALHCSRVELQPENDFTF